MPVLPHYRFGFHKVGPDTYNSIYRVGSEVIMAQPDSLAARDSHMTRRENSDGTASWFGYVVAVNEDHAKQRIDELIQRDRDLRPIPGEKVGYSRLG